MTHRQNTASFERCDLVPNVLRGVDSVDLSVSVMGQRLALPVYCSPTTRERALGLMRVELERDMKLMGCKSISQLSRGNLRFR